MGHLNESGGRALTWQRIFPSDMSRPNYLIESDGPTLSESETGPLNGSQSGSSGSSGSSGLQAHGKSPGDVDVWGSWRSELQGPAQLLLPLTDYFMSSRSSPLVLCHIAPRSNLARPFEIPVATTNRPSYTKLIVRYGLGSPTSHLQ